MIMFDTCDTFVLVPDVNAGPVSAGGKGLLNADAAILSGCSAGGLATYLHCDAFASLVAPTPTKCVADAGYFANIPSMFGMPPPGHENPRKSIIECVVPTRHIMLCDEDNMTY